MSRHFYLEAMDCSTCNVCEGGPHAAVERSGKWRPSRRAILYNFEVLQTAPDIAAMLKKQANDTVICCVSDMLQSDFLSSSFDFFRTAGLEDIIPPSQRFGRSSQDVSTSREFASYGLLEKIDFEEYYCSSPREINVIGQAIATKVEFKNLKLYIVSPGGSITRQYIRYEQ